jgi:hypothetical protein
MDKAHSGRLEMLINSLEIFQLFFADIPERVIECQRG